MLKYKNLFYTIFFMIILTGSQPVFSESQKKHVNPFGPVEKLKKLGTDEFSPEAWANAGQEERGRMIWSFFQQYELSELKRERIFELLGPSTVQTRDPSPINSGIIPAYAIGPEDIIDPQEGWLGYTLMFIVNPWRPEWKTKISVTPTMWP